jgi:hypothetical protein
MLSAKETREHLAGVPLTDEQVENLQAALYALVDNLLDDYLKSVDTVGTCKKLLSTVASPLSDKKLKDTVLKAKNTVVANSPEQKATK